MMAKGTHARIQHGAGEDFDGEEHPEYSPQQRNQGRHPIFLPKMPLNEDLAHCPDGGSQNIISPAPVRALHCWLFFKVGEPG